MGRFPALIHIIQDRDGQPRKEKGCYFPGHQGDGQSLENGVKQDHRGAHDNGGGGKHHGPESDGPGIHHRFDPAASLRIFGVQ